MKALATITLVGLAFGFEDHEFAHHGGHNSKDSTTHKSGHYNQNHKPASSHPSNKTANAKPINRMHLYEGKTDAEIERLERLYQIYHQKYTGTRKNPILHKAPHNHQNNKKPGSEINRLEKIFNRPGYNPERDGLVAPFLKNHQNVIEASHEEWERIDKIYNNPNYNPLRDGQLASASMPDLAHMPLMAKKPISADDDDEFFAAEDNELGCFRRNHTQIQKPVQPRLRPNVAPSRHNATHTHHGSHNRTRPFHPVPHHNRTIPKNLVAYDDEEFFAAEDNVLFDLAKLLIDASKTVGDVKQNPKNYGELLNDAIDIAKDIKRKDDVVARG